MRLNLDLGPLELRINARLRDERHEDKLKETIEDLEPKGGWLSTIATVVAAAAVPSIIDNLGCMLGNCPDDDAPTSSDPSRGGAIDVTPKDADPGPGDAPAESPGS